MLDETEEVAFSESRTELEEDDTAGGVHAGLQSDHRLQLLGGRVGPCPDQEIN